MILSNQLAYALFYLNMCTWDERVYMGVMGMKLK